MAIYNIGIIAHIDAGKTTTTEHILYYSGKTHKIGSVDQGTAEMDFLQEERERGITILSAVTSIQWNSSAINIIDTPGHVDFIAEVKKSLAVIDGGILVICGTAGVQAQTETLYNLTSEANLPLIIFINKLDRSTSSFTRAFESLEKEFGKRFIPITLPIFQNNDLIGLYNILEDICIIYDENSLGKNFYELPLSKITEYSFNDSVQQFKQIFYERLAELDERYFEQFIHTGTVTDTDKNTLSSILKNAVKERKIMPVYSGAALKKKGIQSLLDGVIQFLPSYNDVTIELYDVDNAPVQNHNFKIAYCFKTLYDRQAGKLSFIRIYNGNFEKGDKIFNSNKNCWEKIAHIYRIHADKREELRSCEKGDIVCFIGLKDTETGHTLLSQKSHFFLHRNINTEPVITMSIEPRYTKDSQILIDTLQKIAFEDTSFFYKQNEESGLIEISGMGELHLEVIQHRLANDYGIASRLGAPSIAYKETISQKTERSIEINKVIKDAATHFLLTIEMARGEHNSFEIKNKNIDSYYLEQFTNFSNVIFHSGPLLGYPITCLSITVKDFVVFSQNIDIFILNETLNKLFHECYREAKPIVLEPIMKLDIVSHDQHISSVINDLNAKEADIMEIKPVIDTNNYKRIIAHGYLSHLFGYSTTLRNLTSGQGYFSMEFLNYKSKEAT